MWVQTVSMVMNQFGGMNELSLLTSQTLKSLDMVWGDQRSSSRDYTYYKGVVKGFSNKWHNLDWGDSFL